MEPLGGYRPESTAVAPDGGVIRVLSEGPSFPDVQEVEVGVNGFVVQPCLRLQGEE